MTDTLIHRTWGVRTDPRDPISKVFPLSFSPPSKEERASTPTLRPIHLSTVVREKHGMYWIDGADGPCRVLEIEQASLLADSYWLSFFDVGKRSKPVFRTELFDGAQSIYVVAPILPKRVPRPQPTLPKRVPKTGRPR